MCTIGLTVVSTKEHGRTTKCTAMDSSRGPMVANMKASTLRIRNKAKEFSTGPTVENMRESGRMENRTVWVTTRQLLVK